MATEMHPTDDSRVFAAATDPGMLKELDMPEVRVLDEGHIGGLNGVLLAAAIDAGMRGACLLGEMPHIFAQVPFPKASLAVLQVFAQIAEVSLDFSELEQQSKAVETKMDEVMSQVEQRLQAESPDRSEDLGIPAETDQDVPAETLLRIDDLFRKAERDRSKAFELKNELDRLGLFERYEDRFLDLFKNSGEG